jgi:dihydrofolate reductase
MRRIFLFMNVSLDGYFEGPGHDISWTKGDYEAFSPAESQEVDTMLFGRKTYEMMRSFWPTPAAAEFAPEVARFMNERRKVVVSHASFDPGWDKVTVISDDVAGEIRRLKEGPGQNIIILGSNNLCVSLMQEGLIDEFQILVNPVVLGAGTSLFEGLPKPAGLRLTATQAFKSGTVLLTYEPVEK